MAPLTRPREMTASGVMRKAKSQGRSCGMGGDWVSSSACAADGMTVRVACAAGTAFAPALLSMPVVASLSHRASPHSRLQSTTIGFCYPRAVRTGPPRKGEFARRMGANRQSRRNSSSTLLASGDAKRLHLAIKMASLEAQQLGGVADVVVSLFNFLENVFAFVGVARLLQTGELFRGARVSPRIRPSVRPTPRGDQRRGA